MGKISLKPKRRGGRGQGEGYFWAIPCCPCNLERFTEGERGETAVVKSLTVSYRMSLSCSAWLCSVTHKHITHLHAPGLKLLSAVCFCASYSLRPVVNAHERGCTSDAFLCTSLSTLTAHKGMNGGPERPRNCDFI